MQRNQSYSTLWQARINIEHRTARSQVDHHNMRAHPRVSTNGDSFQIGLLQAQIGLQTTFKSHPRRVRSQPLKGWRNGNLVACTLSPKLTAACPAGRLAPFHSRGTAARRKTAEAWPAHWHVGPSAGRQPGMLQHPVCGQSKPHKPVSQQQTVTTGSAAECKLYEFGKSIQ